MFFSCLPNTWWALLTYLNLLTTYYSIKWAIVESSREVCGSVRAGGKSPKSVWWNNEIKAAVREKEAAWKGVLAVSDEEKKERCMEAYRKEKRKIKKCISQSKKKEIVLEGGE